ITDQTMNKVKVLLRNWSFVRFLRLGLGLIILIQGIILSDLFYAGAGLLLSAFVVLNVACCGMGACAMPDTRRSQSSAQTISYEEVDK
ncbi:MAG: hypothetical protein ACKO6K_10420, partial [Chitinophagaceae bacterium]